MDSYPSHSLNLQPTGRLIDKTFCSSFFWEQYCLIASCFIPAVCLPKALTSFHSENAFGDSLLYQANWRRVIPGRSHYPSPSLITQMIGLQPVHFPLMWNLTLSNCPSWHQWTKGRWIQKDLTLDQQWFWRKIIQRGACKNWKIEISFKMESGG